MILSSQVISLPLAKRLKELKVPQESLFYWVYLGSHLSGSVDGWYIKPNYRVKDDIEKLSAFTVAELGEMLKVTAWCIATQPIGEQWMCWAPSWEDWGIHIDETMANAMAKMLIHLLEKGLIKL